MDGRKGAALLDATREGGLNGTITSKEQTVRIPIDLLLTVGRYYRCRNQTTSKGVSRENSLKRSERRQRQRWHDAPMTLRVLAGCCPHMPGRRLSRRAFGTPENKPKTRPTRYARKPKTRPTLRPTRNAQCVQPRNRNHAPTKLPDQVRYNHT